MKVTVTDPNLSYWNKLEHVKTKS